MHTPVLLDELIDGIFTKDDGIYLDCTGGGGGHSSRILEKLSKNGRLIILDRDIEAVNRLIKLFESEERVTVVHSCFSKAANVLDDLGIDCVHGLIADFGLSNYQLSDGERGFSFMNNGLLDMRMNQEDEISAFDVVNKFSESEIISIIRKYGEENFAVKIGKAIVEYRKNSVIKTTHQLAQIVSNAIPKKFHKQGINPATKTFQAIRIYVNKELIEVETLLSKLEKLICINGRAGFISFHSLEDRIVKNFLKNYELDCICPPDFPVCNCNKVKTFRVLNKKPILASKKEIESNPMSRSAKLRIAERIA